MPDIRFNNPKGADIVTTNMSEQLLPPDPVETTVELLDLAKAGESSAMETLFRRSLPGLRRWARGRLPGYARGMSDTQDLVQETVLHALSRLNGFEARRRGALDAYLREAVLNRIRDEIRRAVRHPAPLELVDCHHDTAPSPLEQAIGGEVVEQYQAALARLRPSDREAIVARVELHQSFKEIAIALGKPTADAARVAVTRAMVRLLREMHCQRQTDHRRSAGAQARDEGQ